MKTNLNPRSLVSDAYQNIESFPKFISGSEYAVWPLTREGEVQRNHEIRRKCPYLKHFQLCKNRIFLKMRFIAFIKQLKVAPTFKRKHFHLKNALALCYFSYRVRKCRQHLKLCASRSLLLCWHLYWDLKPINQG